MRLELKDLQIRNWKGIKHESFRFTERETSIYGANGTGKTSLFAGFVWLLFGKDNFGRADHHIKPLDENNEPIHKLNSEVEASMMLDNKPLSLKRVYREDWTKKGGLKGNTTDYFINDVGVLKREYDAKVAEICSEGVFKAITNPHYFPQLSRDEQRKFLFEMAGTITNEQIIGDNKELADLLNQITGVSFEAFKKEIQVKKRRVQDNIKDIQPRIEELNRDIPEVQDWSEIEEKITTVESEIKRVDNSILDVSKQSEEESNRCLNLQAQINSLEKENQSLKFEAESTLDKEKQELQQQLRTLLLQKGDRERDTNRKKERISYLESEKARLSKQREELISEYRKIQANELVFPEGVFDCPTCKRALDMNDIEAKEKELTENFNKQKSEATNKNIKEGKAIKEQLEAIDKELSEIGEVEKVETGDIQAKIDETQAKIAELSTKTVALSPKVEENNKSIEELKQAINNKPESADSSQYQSQKAELNSVLDEHKKRMYTKTVIENTAKRIAELESQHKTLTQELANLEKKEFLLKSFEEAKARVCEERVNVLFDLVKFKLFRRQENGEIVPDCEATANGKPYSTQNNAMQINMGLDIIKAISKFYNAYAPIFCDNRESVSEIPLMEVQVINLIVDRNETKLTIKIV